MMINKDNYEICFLDYIDGKLLPDQVAELLLFLEKHPDLKQELESFEMVELQPEHISFPHKDKLRLIDLSMPITPGNEEDFFIASQEGDLSKEQQEALTNYLQLNPDKKDQWKAYEKLKLAAASNITYPGKQKLKNPASRTIRLYWYAASVAAAACLFLLFNPEPQHESSHDRITTNVKGSHREINVSHNLSNLMHPLTGVRKKEDLPERKVEVVEQHLPANSINAPLSDEQVKKVQNTLKDADAIANKGDASVINDAPLISGTEDELVYDPVEIDPDEQLLKPHPEVNEVAVEKQPDTHVNPEVDRLGKNEQYQRADVMIASLLKRKLIGKEDHEDMSIGEAVTARISMAIGAELEFEKNEKGDVLAYGFKLGKFEISKKRRKN